MTGRLSPAANLLRNSRLFALPPPLSAPAPRISPSSVAESDTATLPHPVRPSIISPPSSLARGDWGLKRSLPKKSTSDSALFPVVRINQLDTYEHITDFDSANDHTISLKKWQELSLPLSTVLDTGISASTGGGRHSSVFESTADNTYETKLSDDAHSKRFRFKGPWLAGQTEIEFNAFLKTVRRQKPEFLRQLRQILTERKALEMRKASLDRGEPIEDNKLPHELNDEEFELALRLLRSKPEVLGPEIYKFLDLATPPSIPNRYLKEHYWAAGPSNISSVEYATSGPPMTHPSAGLSYLRTKAHMDNHPVVGPLQDPKPVQARVLSVKRTFKLRTFVGVGGFVTEDSKSQGLRQGKGLMAFDPDAIGGMKYWVKAERACIRPDGRLELRLVRATETSKALFGANEPEPSVSLPENLFPLSKTVPTLDH
ncbi:hypothetical protein LOZ12_006359 [Ophidiomyces ophidiicola]|uniref:Uncharacterized protein n=1 Tax=Ophidiomyces ophidiicola TaxID=1387563 RepID=A0ACB8UMR4_9EURO|nr:uncharacterized protein LOZ57_001367 [Ophidiomyces ophidiicola]KAI1908385.1 hypothetical protein LOZ64_005565 [Ophidiomyces ophidiicola]KAI1908754.1 hypothetical protein LOZ61_005384 [Ophidiomyces ophidiicola]KAI1920840.1 hypothetical protein LOZ60_006472 [Ophidiomyces ophidiicola]KAI1933943.1 hypothetical protein LOZ62_006368 [Ophidiomyces ophidiicola]KAI1951953.1 hypothetical protein LOZ57_001367 [Ophidiomyces ophidiicola]